MNKLNDKNAPVKMYTDVVKAMADFDIQARLTRAMCKAGSTTQVTLRAGILNMPYDDAGGIEVLCDDATTQERAAAWVKAALDKAGVRVARTGGSWGRPPQAIGPIFICNTGERVIVVTSMCSIGE